MNTKKDYEEYLNDLGIPNDDLYSNGGRIPDKTKNYGSWLRKNDSIAFNVGYNEYLYTCNSLILDLGKGHNIYFEKRFTIDDSFYKTLGKELTEIVENMK